MTTAAADPSRRSWSSAVAAALASPAQGAAWYALFDRGGQLLERSRDRADGPLEQLLREGDARRALEEVVATGRACERRYECSDRRFGPRRFDFVFHPLHEADGVFGVLVQSRERTGHATRGAMRRAHGMLLEHLEDAVLITDSSGAVRLANPVAQRLLGQDGRRIVGCRLADLDAAAAEAVQRARTQAVPWHWPLATTGEKVLHLDARSRPVTIGGETCVITVLRDVTAETLLRQRRDQVMRDLHDGLGQDLTGISLLLRTLQRSLEPSQAEQRDIVDSVLGIVRQMIDDTRAITQGGAPARIPLSQLPLALDRLARSSAARSGLEIQFLGGVDAALPASDALGTNLYRIAQEAVTNALRHAGARRIAISLDAVGGRVLLQVGDDGAGFDAATMAPGAGLGNMRNRAAAIGAALTIDSAPGQGTRVRCQLEPFREPGR